jgi:hypothetical protein
MTWEEPAFVEINLDAEIGSYQSDFGDEPSWDRMEPPPASQTDRE